MSDSEAGASDESEVGKPLDLDHVLVTEVGQFGRYQLLNIVLVALPILLSAFPSEYIFTAAAIPHRCRIKECGEDSKDNVFDPEWVINAIPATDSGTGFASCSRFVSQGNGSLDHCPADLFSTGTSHCNEQFVYARDNSVVYDFNLGCQEWLRALAGMLNSVGTLLVLPFIGYISDRFGRRIALIASALNLGVFGLIRAFSVNYPMYLAFQLLQTTFGAGTYSTAYIFATELVGPRYRVLSGVTCASLYALGQATLGGAAWLVQPWRYLTLALHIPCLLVLSYYWLLDESVRWQLSKGKFAEAKALLQKVARVNNTQISEKSLDALTNPPRKSLLVPVKEQVLKPNLVAAVFRSRTLLRRVCTTPVWWVTTTLVYSGLYIHAVGLSDTMYLNYMLTALIEVPSYLLALLMLTKLGRKPALSFGFFFCAACNIAFAFIPQDLDSVRLAVFLLGKIGISIVITTLYLYTAELYPTEYRHTLLAFSSMVGRIGSIVSPLTPALMQYWYGIPSAMFAGMAVLSGALVLTQPETLGTKLPDTLAEAEAIGSPEFMRTKS